MSPVSCSNKQCTSNVEVIFMSTDGEAKLCQTCQLSERVQLMENKLQVLEKQIQQQMQTENQHFYEGYEKMLWFGLAATVVSGCGVIITRV